MPRVAEHWPRSADLTPRHGVPEAAAAQRRFSRLQRSRSALSQECSARHNTEFCKGAGHAAGEEGRAGVRDDEEATRRERECVCERERESE